MASSTKVDIFLVTSDILLIGAVLHDKTMIQNLPLHWHLLLQCWQKCCSTWAFTSKRVSIWASLFINSASFSSPLATGVNIEEVDVGLPFTGASDCWWERVLLAVCRIVATKSYLLVGMTFYILIECLWDNGLTNFVTILKALFSLFNSFRVLMKKCYTLVTLLTVVQAT